MTPIARFEVELRDNLAILRPIGELDLATADAFTARAERLLADGFDHVVLDLRQITFMDSSGLRAIVKLHRDATSTAQVQIIDGAGQVQRLFTITGVRGMLTFTTVAEALGNQ